MILTSFADFIASAEGVLSLITGLLGLIGTAVGAFFAIRNFIVNMKEKNAQEIWTLIMEIADSAMKEAEKSGKEGCDKKEMVINAVKAGCKAAKINIDPFLDQLLDYIDQTINFVNDMKKA